MSDTYTLAGSWTVEPNGSFPSPEPTISTPLDETVTLGKTRLLDIKLTADAAHTVDFGGLSTGAHVLAITCDKKVKAEMTSDDGSAQAIPIEGFLKLITKGDVPITAIDLTRVSGKDTNVRVFLGEKP